MNCFYCGGTFEVNQNVVKTKQGLFHEESCFMDYCYDELVISSGEWSEGNEQ